MTSTLSWELVRTFLAVLREGSLSGASRALGITQPTVGRHVSALETALGQVLFTRSQTGLLPTEIALALRGHAEAMESTAASLQRAAAGHGGDSDDVRGVVRIAASEIVGAEVLPAIVAGLREAHPRLTVELVLSNRLQDLLHREADIAVRMTAPQQDQLIARRVGRVEIGMYATADYLARHGKPTRMDDLREHTLIGFDRLTPYIRDVLARFPQFGRDSFGVRVDSDVAQLALTRAGAGIGFCQTRLAQAPVALTRVLPKAFALHYDMWIAMHEDLRDSPRCKVVFDALVRGMQAHANA